MSIGCTSAVIINGKHFPCTVGEEHEGWPHANPDANAVWGCND